MVAEILFLIGRIVVGMFFVMMGMNHFIKRKMMVEYSRNKGVPVPGLAVPVTGLILLVAGLSFGLGIYPEIGVLLASIFLVPTSMIMHNFWAAPEEQRMAEMVNFMKNMALFGSALMFLAIETPWVLSVTI